MDFSTKLNALTARADAALDALVPALPAAPAGPARIHAAMRYSLQAGGKRLRPALALAAAGLAGPDATDAALPVAAALECVHTYSLIHDDLPCMDDDDLRRGRPTCHRAFDEATAILCGDALQALAFEILATGMPAAAAARGCAVLARAAGPEALVGGQMDDLATERGWIADLRPAAAATQVAWMERINRRKTGALFHAALQLGGLAAAADESRLERLAAFGAAFGQAFQIADARLDAEGTEAAVGKRVGKDADRGKLTFPTVLGAEESRRRALALADEAVAALTPCGAAAGELVRLACWIVNRDH